MEVRLLGTVDVLGRSGALPLGPTKQRALFAMLALNPNRVVSVEQLVDGLWDFNAPGRAGNSIQVYVSRLRKILAPENDAILLVRRSPGYVLELPPDAVDAVRFEQLARAGFRALADDPELALASLSTALDLWRGTPMAEFLDEPFAEKAAQNLIDRRLTILISWIDARLALGQHQQLVVELERLVAEYPSHEGLTRQLMLSLYRSGRQPEALEAFVRIENFLREEVGQDPQPALSELRLDILRHARRLDWTPPDTGDVGELRDRRVPETVRASNIPPRNTHFSGRAQLLERLASSLADASGPLVVQSVNSLGGVGKTQLSIEYAHRYADRYDIAWWIDAEQPVLIAEQLVRLAGRLNLRVQGTTSDIVRRLLALLATRDRWLLIFDNAVRPDDLESFRPSGGGQVLVTTRSVRWPALGPRIEIDVMTKAETAAMLKSRVPALSNSAAADLATELGGLPLAAAQAAAYLEQTGVAPTEYVRRFRSQRAALLAHGDATGYHGRVDTTWSLALEQLRTQDQAAVSVLELAAFFAPEPIPYRVFTEHAELLDSPLRRVADDPDEFADAVDSAVRFDLAHGYPDTFQIHRLVQAVIRHRFTAGQQQQLSGQVAALLGASHPGDPNDPAHWSNFAELAPHVLAIGAAGDRNEACRRLLLSTVEYISVRGDTRGSRTIAAQVFDRWSITLGADHRDTLICAANLTSSMAWLADHDRARQLGQDTLTRATKVFGPAHPVTLQVASSLTFALAWLGQSEQARLLGEEAMAHCRDALGAAHPVTVRLAANQAFALLAAGRADESRVLAEATLALSEATLGLEHPITLVTAAHLGLALVWLGRIGQAHAVGSDLLQRSRDSLGSDHPTTLAAAAQQTFLLACLDQLDAATQLGEDAWQRSRNALGDQHLISLTAAATYAFALAKGSESAQARQLAVGIYEHSRLMLGPDNLVTLIAAAALSFALGGLGESAEATQLAAATLPLSRGRLGSEHLITVLLGEFLT